MNTLINNKDIKDIVFTKDTITIVLQNDKHYSQSLKYYPYLSKATESERKDYTLSLGGIHWRAIDTDISFESFFYDLSQPFVYHK